MRLGFLQNNNLAIINFIQDWMANKGSLEVEKATLSCSNGVGDRNLLDSSLIFRIFVRSKEPKDWIEYHDNLSYAIEKEFYPDPDAEVDDDVIVYVYPVGDKKETLEMAPSAVSYAGLYKIEG